MSRCHISEEDSSQSWRPCSAALAVAVSAWIVKVFLPLPGDQDRSPRERTRSPLDRERIERCSGFEFHLAVLSSAITFLPIFPTGFRRSSGHAGSIRLTSLLSRSVGASPS